MKRFLVVVGLLILFLMAISLLLPSKISVAKTITINAPQDSVAAAVNNFGNWPHWFPLLKEKQATLDILSEKTAIIKRNSGEGMNIEFHYRSLDSAGFTASISSGSAAHYSFTMTPQPGGMIRVNLIVNTFLKWYPWSRAKGVFLDKITGPQYEEALRNLQQWCESDH